MNVSVSCGLTNIEKRVIEDAFYKAGVTEVVIIESPLSVKAINSDCCSKFDFIRGAACNFISFYNNCRKVVWLQTCKPKFNVLTIKLIDNKAILVPYIVKNCLVI